MILLIGGDKGGTGKTTLAANLAVCLMAKNKSVILVKTDNNNNISDWYEQRKENNLPLMPLIESFGSVEKDLKILSSRADVIIVDTAGYDSKEFRSALKCADRLLSPIRPSSSTEVNSLSKLNEIIIEAQKYNQSLKANVVFYRCKPNNHNERIALSEYLKNDEDWIQPLNSFVTFYSVFEKAMESGKGVHEMQNAGTAKAQIELLINEIGV